MNSINQNTNYDDKIKVIFEDRDILVIDKPVGILSEDSEKGEKGIISFLKNNERKNIHLLHRLDRNVGGVMVLAKNKKSASVLSSAIANGRFHKKYLAVTEGIPEENSGVYKDLLFKDSRKNRSYVVSRMRKGVREASLEYETLKKCDGKALVKILLHTGRTHQIRVQFSHRKTPLVGDVHYGSKDKKCNIALHSCEISFTHPSSDEEMCFKSIPNFQNYPWAVFGGVANA